MIQVKIIVPGTLRSFLGLTVLVVRYNTVWNTFFFAKYFRHSLEALQVKDTKSEAKTIMKNVV